MTLARSSATERTEFHMNVTVSVQRKDSLATHLHIRVALFLVWEELHSSEEESNDPETDPEI